MIKIRGGKYLHRQLKQPPLEITRSTKIFTSSIKTTSA